MALRLQVIRCVSGALIAGAGTLAVTPVSAQPADLVFVNGTVFTAAGSAPAQGFAIRDGRFIAVGSSEAVRAHVGAGTKIVDFGGRFVTPGLSDGHLHNEGGGRGIDLAATRALTELLAVVERAAKAAQPGDLIVSNADWHEAQLKEQRLPTAKELDQVAPNNPVVLIRGGHEYILNSAAFRKWNIGKDTPSPAGGEIGKEADGGLNGELVDNAKGLVSLPPPGAIICTCGGWVSAGPQVWSTAVMPMRAPRCFLSAAMVSMASAAALNRRP